MTTENSIDARARALGIQNTPQEKPYLDLCARAGNMYYTSGHVSQRKGRLGRDLTIEEGQKAAIESVTDLLTSVFIENGTLENIRVVRLMACVQATEDFTEHGSVINAASGLIHELFGEDLGYHARSALGFASIPTGAAVEIEGIFEIIS